MRFALEPPSASQEEIASGVPDESEVVMNSNGCARRA